jgi:glycosyltransferase involved in cell wall biosynthesis
VFIIKKKIIAIRSHYPDIRLEKEVKSLSNNYAVTIIGWNRHKLDTKISPNINDVLFSINVAPGSIKVPFILPFWWIFISLNLIFRRFDIIHSVDFDSYIPSLLISKIRNKPIVYDIYDFYGETIDFPILKKTCQKFFTKIDKFFMKFADAIIIADDARIEQIGKNYKNVISIYNSPNITYAPKHENILSLNDEFIIFFGGALLEDRGIDQVIITVKELNDEKIKLILMGYPGTLKYGEKIKGMCRDFKNIQLYLKMVPHEQILHYTSKADMVFILYDPQIPNNRYASPNKLFESMCFAKPVIVSDQSSMTKIVETEKCGLTVPYGDLEELRKAILTLKNNPRICYELGNNGRKVFEGKYCWKIMERRLLDIYNEMLKERVNTWKRNEDK